MTENTFPTSDAICRAMAAKVRDCIRPGEGERYFLARKADEVAKVLYVGRANAPIGTTGGSGWASHLAQTAVAQFLASLAPLSAGAALLAEAVRLPWRPGIDTMRVPSVIPAALAGAFVAENEPMPVTSWQFSGKTLSSKRVAFAGVISRELARAPGADAEVRRLLRESAVLTLDAYLFADSAATDAAPAGLFQGVTATVPGAFDSDPLVNDLVTLAGVVAPIAGDRIAYVASPARAVQISARVPTLRYPVFASAAIADTRLVAVALNGLAAAIGPDVTLSASEEAVLHMSDTPAEIVSDTGPTTADPVRSLWQTASVAMAVDANMDWALRDARAIAFMEGLAW